MGNLTIINHQLETLDHQLKALSNVIDLMRQSVSEIENGQQELPLKDEEDER
jgi:prefoldin subunit 5